MDHETASKVRGLARRVVLKNVDDSGETQTASMEVADGILRDKVEIMHPYGFTSAVPEDGALGIAIAIGGDEGDQVLLPVANPSTRMGGLKAGDVGISNAHGDKMVLTAGGDLNITSGASVTIVVGGVTFKISAGGVEITGGQVTHNGKNIGFDHVHKGVEPGGALTQEPA